ncbi:MAG TPA: hypothetical protein VFQ44_05465 [Streptosporangiaceae bacterium]|nr:hypothetical protein [Streptosporangiaceae bacterium]
MHADRTNRVMLLILAVLMITIGAGAGAASIGVYPSGTMHNTLMDNPVGSFFGAHGAWLWPVIAAAAAIVVVLALRWLLTLLFSTDRVADLPIGQASSGGPTVLAAGALTDALAEEIENYHGIRSASARLIGKPAAPTIVVAADLEADADAAGIRRRIETGALTRARTAVGDQAIPARLDLTVTTKPSARVT